MEGHDPGNLDHGGDGEGLPIFFSYGLILERFHGVPRDHVSLYIVPFAIGNFLGPLVLGPLFDRWGRRVMIPLTYALSGVLLLATGGLFVAGALNALTQTLAWMLVFFVASAAAIVARVFGVDAERRSLEEITAGLTGPDSTAR